MQDGIVTDCWNLVSTFGLSCEKGVAWLSLVHCEMLDYACTAHFFIMEIDFSKKKPCALLDFTYFFGPETGLYGLRVLFFTDKGIYM